ncbi:hypothetical protein CRENBAI_023171 [Crenichthys baileyi]|uniref:Uncharacterized protein n=1 Tax=Crenichthys baileyi TaxID=28760 RepID=A0AAV9REJ0_9TELE
MPPLDVGGVRRDWNHSTQCVCSVTPYGKERSQRSTWSPPPGSHKRAPPLVDCTSSPLCESGPTRAQPPQADHVKCDYDGGGGPLRSPVPGSSDGRSRMAPAQRRACLALLLLQVPPHPPPVLLALKTSAGQERLSQVRPRLLGPDAHQTHRT